MEFPEIKIDEESKCKWIYVGLIQTFSWNEVNQHENVHIAYYKKDYAEKPEEYDGYIHCYKDKIINFNKVWETIGNGAIEQYRVHSRVKLYVLLNKENDFVRQYGVTITPCTSGIGQCFFDGVIYDPEHKTETNVVSSCYSGITQDYFPVFSTSYNFNVKLYNDDDQWMPIKSKEDDAAFDLRIRAGRIVNLPPEDKHFNSDKLITLCPGDRAICHTGVYLELRNGWEAQIRPRSGWALKYGLIVVNSPGTIDAGYRNEIAVIVQNNDREDVNLFFGERIAQMVIKKVPKVTLTKVKEINETERGENGFGSTGVK